MNSLVLVVEDNKTIRMYQTATLEKLGLKVLCAENLEEVQLLTKEYAGEIKLAVVDINLPDCEECALDYLLKLNIPSIAMTSSFHSQLHEKIISKNVIDYIVLENDVNLELLSITVQKILNNHNVKVLIVDDSKTSRMSLKTFLIQQNYIILEAASAKEALEIIDKNSDIKIALLDYEMDEMNGAELARRIRKKYSRMEMAILAISIHSEPLISVEFLKSGANDFITKPFIKEEVSARISVNLDMVEMHAKVNKEIEEKKIAELKLEHLNNTLEKRVKIEIEKNRVQEGYLQTQSRMAKMGEMISLIAHQWRQPLNAISLTALNLKFEMGLDKFNFSNKESQNKFMTRIEESLDEIETYVKSLTDTMDDFRNFYKPNKKIAVKKLEDVVLNSFKIMKATLIDGNIKIIEDYNSNIEIEMYDNEVMQVILNVFKNAQDNFKEKNIKDATIKISTENRTIMICDNGGGIPEDIIDKIFDPYISTKDEKDGSGLGLYMSKTIIEKHHNGTISAINKDGGACFIIELGSL